MKKTLTLLLVLALTCTVLPTQAKTIEVGSNSTYKTIQDAINAAEEGDIINVHSGTYSIDKSLFLKSGIELSGDQLGQTILYTDSIEDINSAENPAMLYCHGVSNVVIHDIVFKGPAKTLQEQHEKGGTNAIGGLREARNGIKIEDSNNIKIYNTRYTMLLSDGIRIANSKNIIIYDCIIDSSGHDSISNFRSSGVTIYNCLFSQMINTCVRVDNSESISISNCTFKQALPGTGAGYIELEHKADKVSITNNLFTKSTDPIIFTAYPEGGNIEINNNAYANTMSIQDNYPPYTVTQKNNIPTTELNSASSSNYGYAPNNKLKNIPVESIKTSQKNNSVQNENITSENATLNETLYISDINTTEGNAEGENIFINPYTLSFVIEQTDSAANISREANRDLLTAKSLMNGTTQEKQLSEKYIKASELKIQYAKELLNMSEQSILDAKINN